MLLINLQEEIRKRNYSLMSEALVYYIHTSLQNNEKVVLFHNRAGYARRVVCRDCKLVLECPKCAKPLMAHDKTTMQFFCQLCESTQKIHACPSCSSLRLKLLSFGTNKIQEELEQLFSAGAVFFGKDLRTTGELLTAFVRAPIVLLTHVPVHTLPSQMIIKKYCIGAAALMNADTDLYFPDFSASTKTFNRIVCFQKFVQDFKIKIGIIQTYTTEHAAIVHAVHQEKNVFEDEERKRRKERRFPPEGTLIKLIYQHANQKTAHHEAQASYTHLRALSLPSIDVTPPQPSFTPKVRGNYRFQMMLKTPKDSSDFAQTNEKKQLRAFLMQLPPAWIIDVDPISIL